MPSARWGRGRPCRKEASAGLWEDSPEFGRRRVLRPARGDPVAAAATDGSSERGEARTQIPRRPTGKFFLQVSLRPFLWIPPLFPPPRYSLGSECLRISRRSLRGRQRRRQKKCCSRFQYAEQEAGHVGGHARPCPRDTSGTDDAKGSGTARRRPPTVTGTSVSTNGGWHGAGAPRTPRTAAVPPQGERPC